MKTFTFSAIAAAVLLLGFARSSANADQPSEFDEVAIRAMQEGRAASQSFTTAAQAFEASNDPVVKAAKWEEAAIAASEGLLSATWPTPSDGWKLLDFPASGNLTLQDIEDQQSQKASCTKLVAQNETEAVRLRGAGGLMLSAALDGEQWGEKLLRIGIPREKLRPARRYGRLTGVAGSRLTTRRTLWGKRSSCETSPLLRCDGMKLPQQRQLTSPRCRGLIAS
jgi:hypothetical protein